MKLRATEAPIDRPMPPTAPAARLTAAPTIVASIFEVLSAMNETAPKASSSLSSA